MYYKYSEGCKTVIQFVNSKIHLCKCISVLVLTIFFSCTRYGYKITRLIFLLLFPCNLGNSKKGASPFHLILNFETCVTNSLASSLCTNKIIRIT